VVLCYAGGIEANRKDDAMGEMETASHSPVGAVIVAAGASRRMNGVDKTWAPLAGRPVIAHAIDVFARSALIDHIALVVAQERMEQARELAGQEGWHKIHAVVTGGPRRRDSVFAGLQALPDECEFVAIHDGARPLVTEAIIAEGLRVVAATGAATAAVPVKDTVKRVDAEGFVVETPDRASLYAVQTPQIFRRDLILTAHQAVNATLDVTDDALLVEMQGVRVRIFAGSYTNLKITTPEDLALAEGLRQRN
jgi:2-C-methyl-D-erythritol 4-phosphate cytidylyltransferase